MRILQVIPRFNPILGGGVDVVYNISKHLALRGHEVTIITTDYKFNEEAASRLEDYGVKVYPFKHLFNYSLYIPSPDMKRWIKNNIVNYDIVHLNGTRSYQNNIVVKSAIKFNVPYVLQAHGSIKRIVEKQKIKALYDFVWGNNLIRNASKFIALSGSELEAHIQSGIPKEKIVIVPNGVDITKFQNLPDRGLFRDTYSIEPSDKLVLYLGRLHKSKGLDILIESFDEVNKSLSNVKFAIVGPDGGMRDKLENQVKYYNLEDQVIFTGAISEESKFSAFIDSDVFVTPKFYGFPITFAESCACGLPIVTTNKGEYLDWINKNAGFSVEYNSVDVANAINDILSNYELSSILSKKGKDLVETKFNWVNISEIVECIYEKILK